MAGLDREGRRFVTRVINTFDADILVINDPPPELTIGGRAKLRFVNEELVAACTACELHEANGGHSVPYAPWWPHPRWPRQGRIAVVTDAPAAEERSHGELGHGLIHNLLVGELRNHMVDDETDRVTWLTATACCPVGPDRGGRLTRIPPTASQVAACAPNLHAGLVAADVTHVLLAGPMAAKAWRKDLPLETVRGRWFWWRQQWMTMAVDHPALMIGKGVDPVQKRQWRADVQRFTRGAIDGAGFEEIATASTCVRPDCTGGTYTYDDEGVPWCERHFDERKATWEARRPAKKQRIRGQGKMM